MIKLFGFIVATLLLIATQTFAQQKSQFTIVIDGIEADITAGEETKLKLKSGSEIKVLLKPKDVVTFNAASFSFDHPGNMRVAETKVTDGVLQHLLTTANGTAVIIQSYDSDFEPASLLDLMFNELTEDERARKIEVKREDASRTLASGQLLKGTRASYKDDMDDVTIDILLFPKPNAAGVLFIVMHDKESAPEDTSLVDRFWSSLTVR
jgi:hypothetical protein